MCLCPGAYRGGEKTWSFPASAYLIWVRARSCPDNNIGLIFALSLRDVHALYRFCFYREGLGKNPSAKRNSMEGEEKKERKKEGVESSGWVLSRVVSRLFANLGFARFGVLILTGCAFRRSRKESSRKIAGRYFRPAPPFALQLSDPLTLLSASWTEARTTREGRLSHKQIPVILRLCGVVAPTSYLHPWHHFFSLVNIHYPTWS